MEEAKFTSNPDSPGQMSNKEKRAWRISIFVETKKIAGVGSYQTARGETVTLPRIPTNTSEEVTEHRGMEAPLIHYLDYKIQVFQGDCVDAAMRMQDLGYSVGVLNMASSFKPGGGVRNGAGAQEEHLFRRSNYHLHLYNHDLVHYPITKTGGVYSPNVVFFRDSEAQGYTFRQKPFTLNMIAVPALRKPELGMKEGRVWLNEGDVSTAKLKIYTMLKLATSHGHDCIVLSAWGCGAYSNPPFCIATLFRMAFEEGIFGEDRVDNCFRRVVFAIFDDKNARKSHNLEGNIAPFAEVFQTQVLTDVNQLI